MSNARSTEELAVIYAKQSADPFFTTAMAAPDKVEPVGQRNYINNGCDWPCCNEQGECKPMCFVCVLVCVAGAFVCCCYLTNGFGGAWSYWPY